MDFELPEHLRLIRATVREFTRSELLPHERTVIRRESERGLSDAPIVPPDLESELQRKARDIGLWGIDVPAKFGGQDLGALAKCIVIEELKHSIVPFVPPPDSPNLRYLMEMCRGPQIERYLLPYASGARKSCLALTEPGAGSDAAAIRMRATRQGAGWVLNGEKTFISNARTADFMIVIAVTDPEKRARGGISAFLVDRDAPGLSIPSSFPTIGEYHPYSVFFDNVPVSDEQVLGDVGTAFAPLQRRLGIRRMEIGARCIGLASRCLEMMIEQANARETFGARLADRQAVQWWIADSYREIEMVRLLTYRLACRIDNEVGDYRLDASLAKIESTEMIHRVVDRAIQLFGAMGVSKELPLEYMARYSRVLRIVEGPTEIHRWTVARELLRSGLPA